MEQTVDVERLKRHLSELTWAPTVEISRAELLALLSRLEQAEQAVERVREAMGKPWGSAITAKHIVRRALDGDGRG